MELIKTGERIKTRGATPCPRGWGAPPYLVGPLRLHRPQLQLHIFREHEYMELELKSVELRGAHEAGGAPSTLVGPSLSTDLLLPPMYIHVPHKHPGEPRKPNSTAATFCTHEIPSWGLFWSSAGGGIHHAGLLHHHHNPSDEV